MEHSDKVKHYKRLLALLLTSLFLLFVASCKEKVSTLPRVKTIEITDISQKTAITGGMILDNGNDKIIAKGVEYAIKSSPLKIKTTDSAESENFSSKLTGLSANTEYTVQAYATNSTGTGYGEILTFLTLPVGIPEVTTSEVSKITRISADGGGKIISGNGDSVISKGLCWNTLPGPTTENNFAESAGQDSFHLTINGLSENTTYYVRAFARNIAGIGYGEEKSFTTATLPSVATLPVTLNGPGSAIGGGTIISDGGCPVTARGFCWGRSHNPTINDFKTTDGTGNGTFTSSIAGFTDSTMFFGRAYVITDAGTAYGEETTFGVDQKIVRDIDGNVYHVIRIGTQLWLKENLKTTRYNNGGAILSDWHTAGYNLFNAGYYCNYNDDESLVPIYGRLYNIKAALDQIAPSGWRVPSKEDVLILFSFLGNYNSGSLFPESEWGGKLKETGTAHWKSPNTGADNSTNFTALPGGCITTEDAFINIGERGAWWTTTRYTGWDMAAYLDFAVSYSSSKVGLAFQQIGHGPGYSIRCVR